MVDILCLWHLYLPGFSTGVPVSCVNPYAAETYQGLPSGHWPYNNTAWTPGFPVKLCQRLQWLNSNACLQKQHPGDNSKVSCKCEPDQGSPEPCLQGLLSKLCWVKTKKNHRVLLNVPEEVASLRRKSLKKIEFLCVKLSLWRLEWLQTA